MKSALLPDPGRAIKRLLRLAACLALFQSFRDGPSPASCKGGFSVTCPAPGGPGQANYPKTRFPGVYTLAGCTRGKEADRLAVAVADSSVPDRNAIDMA
jgi:hypothetical protein